MAKYRIITIDGGGVRGIIAARILERLDVLLTAVSQSADLYAGTSTGALIAVCLANSLYPGHIVKLYENNSAVIFRKNTRDELEHLWGLIGARYSTQNRFRGIYPAVGEVLLRDLNKRILVATFQLGLPPGAVGPCLWKARFFHNYPNGDGHERAIDVLMRSTAAPTFFPICDGFIDGGVVANNPSMCALAQALDPVSGNQNLDDIVLLSFGAGEKPQCILSLDGDWGLQQWGFQMLSLLFDADIGLADYQCKQLLGKRYLRVQVSLPRDVAIDDVGSIPDLLALADGADLRSIVAWLHENWF